MTNLSAENEGGQTRRNELRRRLIAAREALPAETRAACSKAIEAHLNALLDGLQPALLAFCWPWRGEFDARALIKTRLARGLPACLPVVVDSGQPLEFRNWTEQAPMVPGRYGIPVPAAGEAVHPDLILLPFNGFDLAGHRLGYGGGYFDRSLAGRVPRPCAVGVGFELGRIASLHPLAHDQPMDYIVTEAGAFVVREGRLESYAGAAG